VLWGGTITSATNELHGTHYTNNVISVTQHFELYLDLKMRKIWTVYFVGKFKVANLHVGLNKTWKKYSMSPINARKLRLPMLMPLYYII